MKEFFKSRAEKDAALAHAIAIAKLSATLRNKDGQVDEVVKEAIQYAIEQVERIQATPVKVEWKDAF